MLRLAGQEPTKSCTTVVDQHHRSEYSRVLRVETEDCRYGVSPGDHHKALAQYQDLIWGWHRDLKGSLSLNLDTKTVK
jgi:hypothetical protein